MARLKYIFNQSEVALIVALYQEGKTDAEIAKVLGIPRSTFLERIKSNELTDTIKKAKIEPNEEVKKSLFKRAIGYQVIEIRIEDTVDNDPKSPTYKQSLPSEPQKMVKTTKHILPDVAACFIWLKNRDPENWKDRQEVSFRKLPKVIKLVEKTRED